MRRWLALGLALGLSGCGMMREETMSKEAEETVRQTEVMVGVSRTLSGLATIEQGIGAFHRAERGIPATIESLIPKYLAEVPIVEIGRHKNTARVQLYPPDILRDGQIDGSKLRDTGRWGYVFNQRQVVIFVDCTHQSRNGRPWYQERGVY